jgi:hypothetical protein
LFPPYGDARWFVGERSLTSNSGGSRLNFL